MEFHPLKEGRVLENSYSFLPSVLGGVNFNATFLPLYPQEKPVPIVQEAVWAPVPVSNCGKTTLLKFGPRAVFEIFTKLQYRFATKYLFVVSRRLLKQSVSGRIAKYFPLFHVLSFNYSMYNDKNETNSKKCVGTHTLKITKLYFSLTCKINLTSSSYVPVISQDRYHLHLFQRYALLEILKTVCSCCVQGKPKILSITNIDKVAFDV